MEGIIENCENVRRKVLEVQKNCINVNSLYKNGEAQISPETEAMLNFNKVTIDGLLSIINAQFCIVENLCESVSQLKHEINIRDLIKH